MRGHPIHAGARFCLISEDNLGCVFVGLAVEFVCEVRLLGRAFGNETETLDEGRFRFSLEKYDIILQCDIVHIFGFVFIDKRKDTYGSDLI